MPRPAPAAGSDPPLGLPVLDRLAPPPPAAPVAAAIEAVTAPGDVVVDLAGRGGWVARLAHSKRRKAISLETNPLARLAAEIVLPTDERIVRFFVLEGTPCPKEARALGLPAGDRRGGQPAHPSPEPGRGLRWSAHRLGCVEFSSS